MLLQQRAAVVKAAVVLAALLGATLIFGANLKGNAVRYYTVDQYAAQRSQIGDRFIQLQGSVVPGSLRYDPVGLSLRFEIEKKGARVPVSYHGVKPDVLNDGLDVVVDGRMGPDGVFRGKKLTVKCPSRYTATQQASAGPGR